MGPRESEPAMDIDSIPLFAMLKGRMGYLNQRQQVIAQNLANASTPGFTPQDLNPFIVRSGAGGGPLVMTPVPLAGGMSALASQTAASIPIQGQGASSSTNYKPVGAPDDETKLDGNQVVLEQQMLKLNDTRSQYDIAVGIYQKAMGFLQMATEEPGKGG